MIDGADIPPSQFGGRDETIPDARPKEGLGEGQTPKSIEQAVKTGFATLMDKEVGTNPPEYSLEEVSFRIDSTGWNPIVLEDVEGNSLDAKLNPEGDVWELENGVQLFTPVAMFREAEKAGREEHIMTKEQALWFMSNPDTIPEDITYAGYLHSKDGKIHCKEKYPTSLLNGDGIVSFQPNTAHFWIRPTFWSRQWAIQVNDIRSLEKDSQSYFIAHARRVTSSTLDMASAAQVLLLKNA